MSDSSQGELERLRAIEERHRQLFANMGAAFVMYELVMDEAGRVVNARILEVNPAFERLVHSRDGVLVGELVTDALPHFDHKNFEFLGHVAATGQPQARLAHVPAVDRYVDWRAYCPKAGHVAVQLYDVTEQKRLEQKSAERDRRLDALVTSAMDAIVSLDEQQRILLFNPAAEKMFRCSAAEAMGRDFGEFIAPRP